MSETTTRVLLVENESTDAARYRALLSGIPGREAEVVSTGSLAHACELLRERPFDLIVLDLFLEDEFGIDSFVRIFSQAPDVPIVILAAEADEELAAQAVGAGATSYVLKRSGSQAAAMQVIASALDSGAGKEKPAERVMEGRAAFLEAADRYVTVAARAGKRLLLFAATINQAGGIEASYGRSELMRASEDAAEMLRVTFRASDLLARLEQDRFAGLAIMNLEDNGPEVVAARLREVTGAERARSSRPYDLSLRFRFKSMDPDEIVTVDELALEADRMLRAMET